ncbi:peptidoglycan-binding protein [Acidisoma cellulosilytica]|uniref:Peptidoglycan-binding protein n=1 Tax=Acidisoma cellulosilyticum TaxID=2802395 RepID=A0A963Z0Q3_9PROT|nr:peptidoglycan-binding protein [Acidisoma cellulosilyticum]MCB8880389.1 peptidoglycan-binding protein [Acidisoma cellulosilyticum]
MLSIAILTTLWPLGDRKIPGLRAAIVAVAPRVFATYGLTSDLLIAHAMAQFSHECGAGIEVEENLNYSAQGLMATWPNRFDAAKAALFAHQPEKIANDVYDGRLGNQPGSDDGWNFRGRGGSQVTGRASYQKLGAKTGIDLVNHPEQVNSAEHFLDCAVADFVLCGCLPFAAEDNIQQETLHLNGGLIGLAQRTAWLAHWKAALAVDPNAQGGITWVQTLLNRLGQQPLLTVDGNTGPATVSAIKAFQMKHGLPPDGVVALATLAALRAAETGLAAAAAA